MLKRSDECYLVSINFKILLSENELSTYAQMETEYQKESEGGIKDRTEDQTEDRTEDGTDIQSNKSDEMVKYCSECLTMGNLIQVRSLQSELDLKFHQARKNCHQCQFKVSLLHSCCMSHAS